MNTTDRPARPPSANRRGWRHSLLALGPLFLLVSIALSWYIGQAKQNGEQPAVGALQDVPGAASTGTADPLVPGGGLAAHEAAGGHTIARHVGKTDADLKARLAAEPRISAASTFADQSVAERAVAEALNACSAEIRTWLAGTANRINPPLRVELGYPVGRSLRRGAAASTEAQSVLIVLQRDASLPTGYRIVTAYPVP